MNEQFAQQVGKVYSEIINVVDITRPYAVSFDGSQKPYEFFSAWEIINDALKDVNEPTFLEVGAYKGLWAIAFFEWCKLNNKKGSYGTITWMEHNPANKDLLKVISHYQNQGFVCKLIDANSQLEETAKQVTVLDPQTFNIQKIDVILIDADHRYEGALKDIQLYKPLVGKLLVFHDIRPQEPNDGCGVFKAITDSNVTLDHQIACGNDIMGIGIMEVK